MTGTEKLAEIWRQVHEIRAEGAARVIACPYCFGRIVEGEDEMCCPTMGQALKAVLDAADLCEQVDQAKRIRGNSLAEEFRRSG